MSVKEPGVSVPDNKLHCEGIFFKKAVFATCKLINRSVLIFD